MMRKQFIWGIAVIVALSFCGCKKSKDFEIHSLPKDQTASLEQSPIDQTTSFEQSPIEQTTSFEQSPKDQTASFEQNPIDQTTSFEQSPIDQTAYPEQSQNDQQDSTEDSGSLSKQSIQKVIKQDADKINACFKKGFTSIPNVDGDIMYEMSWTISKTGKAIDPVLNGTFIMESGHRTPADNLYNKKVEKCMLNIINQWKFPAPKGGGKVQLSYPFVFKK